jgi:hypothetical protein
MTAATIRYKPHMGEIVHLSGQEYIYIYIRVASEPRRGSGGQGIIARAIPTWPRPRTIVLCLDCSNSTPRNDRSRVESGGEDAEEGGRGGGEALEGTDGGGGGGGSEGRGASAHQTTNNLALTL